MSILLLLAVCRARAAQRRSSWPPSSRSCARGAARSRHEAAGGQAGRPRRPSRISTTSSRYLSACQLGITLTSLGIGFLGEPAVAKLIEPLFGDACSHGVSLAISLAIAYLITTSLHITIGEQVPKIYAIQQVRAVARLRRAAADRLHAGLPPVHRAAQRGLERDPAADRDPHRASFDEGGDAGGAQVLIQQSMTGGKLDPGEAGMLTGVFHLHEQQARQVMTPAPAVVTVDVSEDVETALRRCVSSGHTRLVVTEDDNQRPREGHRARQRARPEAARRGRRGDHRGARARGADRAGDQAARRPAGRPPAPALVARGRDRRVRPHRRDRHRRGHHRGGRRRDRRRDRPARRRGPPARQRRLVRARPRRDHRPRSTTGSSCRSTPTPTTRSAASCSASSGGCPKRGDTVSANGYSIRVESVRENRIEAVRIRERRVS